MQSDRSAALERDMLKKLAFAYMDEPRIWAQCKDVLRTYKFVREVEPRVKKLAHELSEIPSIGGAPSAEKSISDVWQGAPVSEHVYAPRGYSVSCEKPCIERLEPAKIGEMSYEKRMPVSLTPIVITRRIGHVQNKSILLEVQFKTSHGWKRLIDDRDVFFSARKIVDTAKHGVPVGTHNAAELSRWLSYYEDSNVDNITLGFASGSMGWQGEDDNPTHHGFMCGKRQIGGNGRAIELEGSEGDMAEASELRERGSFDKWLEAVSTVVKFPAIRIAICAALAAPLIAIVEGPNGVIEWAGRTSTGKSTVLKIAQSCWRSATSKLATWNTTIIGIEAAAQFQCDLPLIIDDTSAAVDGGRSQGLGKVIYQLVSGRARGRATRDGGQRTRSKWRTLVLASGETPLGELAKAEGASARVLTFWSSPLGDTSSETGALVSSVMHELGVHSGHAGPRVVQWLCDNRDQWDRIRAHYAEITTKVRNEICSAAAARLAEVIALLECANWVAVQAGCSPWSKGPLYDDPEIVEALRGAMTLATASSDRAYDAWEHALGDAQAKPKSWIPWGESPNEDRDPPGGWLGYYGSGSERSVGDGAEEYAWFPHQLRKVLEQGGYIPEGTLRAWKDLGVLIKPEKSRFTSQVRPQLDRKKLRLVRVRTSYPGHELEEDD